MQPFLNRFRQEVKTISDPSHFGFEVSKRSGFSGLYLVVATGKLKVNLMMLKTLGSQRTTVGLFQRLHQRQLLSSRQLPTAALLLLLPVTHPPPPPTSDPDLMVAKTNPCEDVFVPHL